MKSALRAKNEEKILDGQVEAQAAALGLDDDQKAQLRALVREENKALLEERAQARANEDPSESRVGTLDSKKLEAAEKKKAAREAAWARKVDAILNAEQRQKAAKLNERPKREDRGN